MKFTRLRNQIRPVEHMEWLEPCLPDKYSPLQPSGAGLQSIYLTRLSEGLARQLIDIIGTEARAIQQSWMVNASDAVSTLVGQAEWEEHQIDQIKTSATLTERRSSQSCYHGEGRAFSDRASPPSKRAAGSPEPRTWST